MDAAAVGAANKLCLHVVPARNVALIGFPQLHIVPQKASFKASSPLAIKQAV